MPGWPVRWRSYRAILRLAVVRRAKFVGANLMVADLSAARLSTANLDEANLSGANLRGGRPLSRPAHRSQPQGGQHHGKGGAQKGQRVSVRLIAAVSNISKIKFWKYT